MKETPQEYTRRISAYMEGKDPLQVQAATAKKLERLIKGVLNLRESLPTFQPRILRVASFGGGPILKFILIFMKSHPELAKDLARSESAAARPRDDLIDTSN